MARPSIRPGDASFSPPRSSASPIWRRVRQVLGILLLFVFVVPAQANVIFNNFGVGDTYNVNAGATLSVGSPVFVGSDIIQGDAFTPIGSNFFLGKIELAVGLVQGPNELNVSLMSDASGAPGAVIEAFHFSGAMGPFGGFNPPLVGDSVLHPILTAGTQYWLVASVTDPVAHAAWDFNSIGDLGPHACRQQNLIVGPRVCPETGWRVDDPVERDAFRISGTPVPEPATLLLLGTGLAGMTGIAWRRSRLTSSQGPRGGKPRGLARTVPSSIRSRVRRRCIWEVHR